MSLQTRSVPVEDVQKIQKSLWRQSSAVKDAIRDAAGRVLEHVRSRETFLLEQVELLERAKFELLIENLVRDGGEADADAEMNEAILEFASMELGVESGFRALCDAIANFGPEMLKDGEMKKPERKRHESTGSSLESDFCVLDDDSCVPRDSVASLATGSENVTEENEAPTELHSHFAVLERSPLSEWLLSVAHDENESQSFFGEASRYALDYGYWLREDDDDDDEEEVMEEDEEGGWEKWLHPSSSSAVGAAEEAFFSDYMRFLRQSSGKIWIKDAPETREVRIPAEAMDRTEALTTNATTTTTTDGWLLKPRHKWHQQHPHHYGECADSCRALPEEGAEMEIENIASLLCLSENPARAAAEDALSQWILKPNKKAKGRGSVGIGRKNTVDGKISDWLLEENSSSQSACSPRMPRSQSVVDEWLQSTEELVKGLCKANEPCSGFSGCLSDINCKKGKNTDDEEKEKEDENKEVDSKEKDVAMSSDSDEWVLPKKLADDVSRPAQEGKITQFLRTYHAASQDYWLTT